MSSECAFKLLMCSFVCCLGFCGTACPACPVGCLGCWVAACVCFLGFLRNACPVEGCLMSSECASRLLMRGLCAVLALAGTPALLAV